MKARYVVGLLLVMLAASGCNSLRQVAGMPVMAEPTINIKSAETRWLLIKNPRFGDVRSEPEYIWVEEDKMPTTMTTLLRGKSAIIAPPEVVAKYGQPPGGGKISTRQGTPYQTVDPGRPGAADPRAGGSAAPAPAPIAQLPLGTPPAQGATPAAPAPVAPAAGAPVQAAVPVQPAPLAAVKPAPAAAPAPPKRGYVVHVEPTRIVIDLTAVDGLQPGSVVSLRRDRVPLVHPVTGEVLGDLDDEVGTARVTEIREKFSLAEVQATAPGVEVQVRDRVFPK
jgi:hypothetical protein